MTPFADTLGSAGRRELWQRKSPKATLARGVRTPKCPSQIDERPTQLESRIMMLPEGALNRNQSIHVGMHRRYDIGDGGDRINGYSGCAAKRP